jgi:hypothetical protein
VSVNIASGAARIIERTNGDRAAFDLDARCFGSGSLPWRQKHEDKSR